MTTTSRRIPELDGLRGVAILLVLSWHIAPSLLAGAPDAWRHAGTALVHFSWSGVDLFFVLSGFLIGGILLDNRAASNYFRTFYVRRFYRILPLYLATLIAFVALRQWPHAARVQWLFDRPMPIWSYLTFTQNVAMARAGTFGAQWLGVTWSLAIEEQFYLLLPVVIWWLPERMLWTVVPLLAAAAPATRLLYVATDSQWSWSAYLLLPSRADALLLGVIAALAMRAPHVRAAIERRRTALHLVLAAAACAVAVMALRRLTTTSPQMALYGYSVLAIFYAIVLLIAVTSRDGEIVGRILRTRALRWTGTLAYGTYVLHMPMLGLAGAYASSPFTAGIVALIATFTLASLSWRWFERPLVERGHRWQYERAADAESTSSDRRVPHVLRHQPAESPLLP